MEVNLKKVQKQILVIKHQNLYIKPFLLDNQSFARFYMYCFIALVSLFLRYETEAASSGGFSCYSVSLWLVCYLRGVAAAAASLFFITYSNAMQL